MTDRLRKALLITLALVVVGCGVAPPTPWDADMNGGTLLYRTDIGLGFCGGTGCPTRIVQIGSVCVTETYRSSNGWEYRESNPCRPTEEPR